MNNIKLNKITSLGVLCAAAFFAANSAFAADYTLGGSYTDTDSGDYTYDNWTSDGAWTEDSFTTVTYYQLNDDGITYSVVDNPVSGVSYYTLDGGSYTATSCETYYTLSNGVYTALDYATASTSSDTLYVWNSDGTSPAQVTVTTSYDNMTIGAGSTYSFNAGLATKPLTVGNVYLYGFEDTTAKLNLGTADTKFVATNMYLDYGTFIQSADLTVNISGVVSMKNASVFQVAAGAITVGSITMGDTSKLLLNGSDSTKVSRTFTATSIVANDSSSISMNLNQMAVTITNLTMNDNSTLSKTATGALTFNGALTMNGSSSFSKSAGRLIFNSGSSITMDGGTFSSDLTELNGTGTISLALASVDLTGDTATATILGSINLGTVTYGSGAEWTIKLDVSNVLDDYIDDFTVDLSDLITISSTSNLSIGLVDSEGNAYGDYSASLSETGTTVSFTYAGGAAVPEPSTYAMIFGVVALGFAYYRRRK